MTGLLFWFFLAVVIYTYAGYPLLLAALARLFPARPLRRPSPSYAPSVTLLIAAHNEEKVIAEKLRNALALDYPSDRLQILVAADGSDDATARIVAEYAPRGVELSYHPARRGKMAAINRAMAHARGDVVVFSDANNLYPRDALRRLVAPFADPSVGAATGAKVIASESRPLSAAERLYWRYDAFIKQHETRLGCCAAVAGEIFAIRRADFHPPPDHVINDDFYIAMRIARRGRRVVYVPAAKSIERASPSAADEITRRSRIVAGRWQSLLLAPRLLTWRHPVFAWQVVSHKFLRPFVPLAALGALIATLAAVISPADADSARALFLAPPYNWVALTLQAAFYLTAALGARAATDRLPARLLYLPTYLVNSNLAALIGAYRFLTRGQSVLWKRVSRGND